MSRLVQVSEPVIAKWKWLHEQGVPSDNISEQLWPFSDSEVREDLGGWSAVPKKRALSGKGPGKGHLYALTNPSMPGLLKIGYTTGPPAQRAEQLQTTGVPTPFVVEWESQLLATIEVAEQEAHDLLRHVRIDSAREFFRISHDEAMPVLRRVESEYLDTSRQEALGRIEAGIAQVLREQQQLADEWKTWSKNPHVLSVTDQLSLIEKQHRGPGLLWSLFSLATGHTDATNEEARRASAEARVKKANAWRQVRGMTSNRLWKQLAKYDWTFLYIWEGVGRSVLAHDHGNPAALSLPDDGACWARSQMSPEMCGAPATHDLYGQKLCKTHAP